VLCDLNLNLFPSVLWHCSIGKGIQPVTSSPDVPFRNRWWKKASEAASHPRFMWSVAVRKKLVVVWCELNLAVNCDGGWWRWALVSPDGVAPSRLVGVSASVNLPLHHKVQKFSSGTGSPGWSRKKGRKTVVVCWRCKLWQTSAFTC